MASSRTEDESPDSSSITLSPAQAEVLLFFAGELDRAGARVATTTALVGRGLLERDAAGTCYEISALGRQVADRLDLRVVAERSRPIPSRRSARSSRTRRARRPAGARGAR